MTPLDRNILAALQRSKHALSAYEVAHLVSAATGKVIFPNSVYRGLRRLVAVRRVHNVVSLKAFIAVPPNDEGSQLLMICDHCGQISFSAVPDTVAALTQLCAVRGFKPDMWCLELVGQCEECSTQPCAKQAQSEAATFMSHSVTKTQDIPAAARSAL